MKVRRAADIEKLLSNKSPVNLFKVATVSTYVDKHRVWIYYLPTEGAERLDMLKRSVRPAMISVWPASGPVFQSESTDLAQVDGPQGGLL